MNQKGNEVNRRAFLTGAGVMVLAPHIVRGYQANSAVRVGLLGCGGRGTADATSMVENAGGRVVALADLFNDRLEQGKAYFNTLAKKQGYAELDSSMLFSGPKAAEKIAAAKDLDAIVIATPPYYHPDHLKIVVDAGKHVYCEKPVAVDVPGAKRVLEIAKKAEGKLSLEVGFQIRSAPPFVELVKRIHEGALGEIAFGEAHYYCPFIDMGHKGVPAPQARLRSWLYDRVLSGDIIVEQNIHAIDICNWVLKGHPVKAVGIGGRKGRTETGNSMGHCSVSFTYPNDVHLNFNSKQFGKGGFDVNESFFGTKGNSSSPYSGTLGITGDEAWTWKDAGKAQQAEFSASGSFSDNLALADAEKHKSFLGSITSGKFHNQASMGVESSLSAMLGRAAIYAGHEVTWDTLLRSTEAWDAHIDLTKMV